MLSLHVVGGVHGSGVLGSAFTGSKVQRLETVISFHLSPLSLHSFAP
jgi:hypothetical protein